MKNSAFILNMLLAIFLFAQPEKFTELNTSFIKFSDIFLCKSIKKLR